MILIAEDNQLMRTMLRSIVEVIDPDIVECSDGAAACRLYELHRPSWVLMDIQMGDHDGLTATRAITDRFPLARIVIVTEYDDEATRKRAFEAGATDFVGKDNLMPLRSLISGPISGLSTASDQ